MPETFCPATMCPIMAPNGSIWTGNKNSPCDGPKCGWWVNGGCMGKGAAEEQVLTVESEGSVLQLNPSGNKFHKRRPLFYDCSRAGECQWQKEAKNNLCPPRLALQKGLDPRVCLY